MWIISISPSQRTIHDRVKHNYCFSYLHKYHYTVTGQVITKYYGRPLPPKMLQYTCEMN